jgi:outer membrane protein assembly factor BamB
MMVRRFAARWLRYCAWALCAGLAASPAGGADDFSVVHLSDVHISPQLASQPPRDSERGQATIDWITRQVRSPQAVAGWEKHIPAPAFAVLTGDITEYGVIDGTWEVVERLFDALPFRWFAVPGNHDNTWVAAYDAMRRRHGGENHSFDHGGCHFVFICSASPQEPVPSIDGKTRAWLKADLAGVHRDTPVFVALHHPPDIDEFANPYELHTLVDLLRDHNVQLVLVGHGHSVRRHDLAGVTGIQGGSTFGGNAGYGVLHVQDQRVRYAYHYHQAERNGKTRSGTQDGWRVVHDGPMRRPERYFDLSAGAPEPIVRTDRMTVRIAPRPGAPTGPVQVTCLIDGAPVHEARHADASQWAPLTLPVGDLAPGYHLFSMTARWAAQDDPARYDRDLRTRVFRVDREGAALVWRREFPSAFKAQPVVVDDLLILAGTDGVIRGLERADGRYRWEFPTGGEILATPALARDRLIVGSGDGVIRALSLAGKLLWATRVDAPVYGVPVVAGETVYVGDNQGRMHALAVADGTRRWTFARADYAIEAAPAVAKNALVFGAWDGMLYALNRADGSLLWKTPGPKSSLGKAVRYYAPADCGPLAISEQWIVCDRGYHLGAYDRGGKLLTNTPANVAAIAAGGADGGFYVRHLDDRVSKRSADGTVHWDVSVPAGRFPIPPTIWNETVYVCSNTGELNALAARDGRRRWSYQATPGCYVMAPVAVADDGTCFVAGMDGGVTAVRPRPR